MVGIWQLQAQSTVTVTPIEYSGALTNPAKGFRPSFRGYNTPSWDARPYVTLVRHYIHWNDIENVASDGVDKILQFCDQTWAGCEEANVKIIPRVILEYMPGEYYWPSDMPEGDYHAPGMEQRIRDMIAKLGEAWNNDPRVAWVQTGILGAWGEQEQTQSFGNYAPINGQIDYWVSVLGPEFTDHLPNKRLVVRNPLDWTEQGVFGVYWDSFSHTGQYYGSWSDIKTANTNTDLYVHAPVEGEVAYDWGEGNGLDNFCDASLSIHERPNSSVQNPDYYNFIINTTRQLHTSSNGWISDYTHDATTEEGAKQIQKALGYRFVIDEFQVSERTELGNTLSFTAKVTNTASAPIYENWLLAFILVDETTRDIVLQEVISGVNIRDWHPGSNFDWDPISNPNGSKVYLTPAQQNVVNGSVIIPTDFTAGEYLAGIAIIDPTENKPGVFFAVENFFKESQSQPLCRIGIGSTPSNTALNGVSFDDPNLDDNRSYTTAEAGVLTERVTINPSSLTLSVGRNYQFSAFVMPLNAEDKSVTWSSSNTSIATVDNTGQVSALSIGVATITATTNDTGKSGTCQLTVVESSGVDTIINIDVPDQVYAGQSFTATVEYEASTTRDIEVILQKNSSPWTEYGSATVTVAGGVGTEYIDVDVDPSIPQGNNIYKIVVDLLPEGGAWPDRLNERVKYDVDAVSESGTVVTGITLSGCPASEIVVGNTHQLSATILPAEANDKGVKWNSSNTSVATVDANGLVTAISSGISDITVTSNDGGFTELCSITVSGLSSVISQNGPSGINIYPTIVDDGVLNIVSNSHMEQVHILDITGKIVYQEMNNTVGTIVLEIGKLKSGLYFIHVKSGGKITRKMLIVK